MGNTSSVSAASIKKDLDNVYQRKGMYLTPTEGKNLVSTSVDTVRSDVASLRSTIPTTNGIESIADTRIEVARLNKFDVAYQPKGTYATLTDIDSKIAENVLTLNNTMAAGYIPLSDKPNFLTLGKAADLYQVKGAYVSETDFNTYKDSTAPAAFVSQSVYNTYTNSTAPANFTSKTDFNTYTTTTAPANFTSKKDFNDYISTTAPNVFVSQRTYDFFTNTTAPSRYVQKTDVENTLKPNTLWCAAGGTTCDAPLDKTIKMKSATLTDSLTAANVTTPNLIATNTYTKTEADAAIDRKLQSVVSSGTIANLATADVTVKSLTTAGNISTGRAGFIRMSGAGDPVHSIGHAAAFNITDQDGPFIAGWKNTPAGVYAGSVGSVGNTGGVPTNPTHAMRWDGAGKAYFPQGANVGGNNVTLKIGSWNITDKGGRLVFERDGTNESGANQGHVAFGPDGNINSRRFAIEGDYGSGWIGDKINNLQTQTLKVGELVGIQSHRFNQPDGWLNKTDVGTAAYGATRGEWEKFRIQRY